ncbi:MAG: hypothetical protein AB2989_03880 [Candidatus Symbiodolus clandestinus]
MVVLCGVKYDIPKRLPCKNFGRTVFLSFLEECTVQGKFLAFTGVCEFCGLVKGDFAGEEIYINEFLQVMKTPEFAQIFSKISKIN